MVGAPGEITNRGGDRLRHLTTTLRASQLIYELVITSPGLLPPIIFHNAWEASGERGLSAGGGGRQEKAHQGLPRGWLSFPLWVAVGRSCHVPMEVGRTMCLAWKEDRPQGGRPGPPWFRAE